MAGRRHATRSWTTAPACGLSVGGTHRSTAWPRMVKRDFWDQIRFMIARTSPRRVFLSAALAPVLLWAPLAAQHFHRLPATPQTVAWGYYSAAATPLLHLASRDPLEVEPLTPNRPHRLEAPGAAPG